jgi:hypothetical protein
MMKGIIPGVKRGPRMVRMATSILCRGRRGVIVGTTGTGEAFDRRRRPQSVAFAEVLKSEPEK